MSGVSPSDGGYNYYQKRIGDLEDELKRDNQRAKERMEQRTQSLEESYKQNLARKDEDTTRTIENARQNANDEITRDRDYNRAETERIRNQYYDKWGRYGANNETDALNQQLNEMRRASEISHQQDQAQLDRAEQSFQQRYEDLNKSHKEELGRAIASEREVANENYSNAVKDSNAQAAQLKQDNKHAEERFDARTHALEESYKRNLASHDEDAAKTIQSVKDNSSDTITREREYNKNELDRIRNQTYDKWGRYGGNESDVLTQQLNDLKRSSDLRHEQDEKNLRDAENAYQRRLEENNRDHDAELSRVAKTARDSANDTYTSSIKDAKNQYQQLRDDEQKRYDDLNSRSMEQMNFQRRESEKAINTAQHDYEHRLQNEKEGNEYRFHNAQRSYADTNESATQRLNDSHQDESRVLRDQIKDLIEAEGRYEKEKGKGTQDAIAEYDNAHREEKKLIQSDYEKQIDKLKRQAEESDTYFAHVNNRNLAEKDRYFADLISKTKLEAHQENQDLQKTFESDRAQLVTRNQRDREQASKTLESQLHDANVVKDVALENQAKAYQDTIARNRDSDDTKIKALERELLTKSTSQDTSLISPAAEAAVRKSVIGEYEKNARSEFDRNRGSEDSIQRAYADRLQGAILENDARRTAEQHLYANERHHDEAEFLEHIQDTEFQKNIALRNNELEHDRQTENLNRNYSQMMLRQRNEYENILEAAKNDAAARISGIRQEAEFQSKMAQRAFSARQNELMRDYEKKLADQKNDYEAKMEEVKNQAQTAVREGERKNRVALEEQARGYEQRIAALEYQQKERERYITENYQDQLEKVQRSNALLIQKKS